MEIKADYGKLYDMGMEVVEQTDILVTNLNDILKIIEELENSWQGTDYNNFKTTAVEFINSEEGTTEQLQFMGKYLTYASGVYSDFNELWGTRMRRIGVDDYEDGQR